MSNTYKKIQYVSEGAWGSDDPSTLYYHYNGTGNCITILDGQFNIVISYTRWGGVGRPDLGKAISFLLNWDGDTDWDALENCTVEEIEKIRGK